MSVISLVIAGYAVYQTRQLSDTQQSQAQLQNASSIEFLEVYKGSGPSETLTVFIENTSKWPLVFADIYWAEPGGKFIVDSLEDVYQCQEISFSSPSSQYPYNLLIHSYLVFTDNQGKNWYRYVNGVPGRYHGSIPKRNFIGGPPNDMSGCSIN